MAVRKRKYHREYDPEPFNRRINELLEQHNESYREASLRAGLDHQAVRRYVVEIRRPDRESCIILADHFGINPNELLQLAGYKPLKLFDVETVSAESLPTEAVDVALAIAKIPDPGTRKTVAQAVLMLLEKFFETQRG
ncbi:MAG: helix-turn-helix transcriptional regulator [Thermoflexales bacterium]|nr:helix-turn-helix transcriptional regulator [Thermoflexales bacterium]